MEVEPREISGGLEHECEGNGIRDALRGLAWVTGRGEFPVTGLRKALQRESLEENYICSNLNSRDGQASG